MLHTGLVYSVSLRNGCDVLPVVLGPCSRVSGDHDGQDEVVNMKSRATLLYFQGLFHDQIGYELGFNGTMISKILVVAVGVS